MGWITLKQAAERGPSLPVWQRRIEGDRVPHHLDAQGRRMVWVDGPDPTAGLETSLQEALERLERLERLLTGGQWVTVRRAAARAIAPAIPRPEARPTARRMAPPPIAPRRKPRPTPQPAPQPFKAKAPLKIAPSSDAPAEVLRLYQLTGNDRAAAELLGRNRSEFWRWRTGKRKIGKANLQRIRDAISGLEQRKAA